MSKKVVTVLGARPQFVKAACLSRALKKHGITEVIVHTGQHYDDNMSDIFFREMQIPEPAYRFSEPGQTHAQMTGRMMEKIEAVLLEEKPALVIVFGDTNTTLAGALAAKKLNIKLAHVEAGLRTYDMSIPEEVNRVVTDRISNYLFCPTGQAMKNLEKEGLDQTGAELVRTGDIMADAVLHYSALAAEKSSVQLPEEPFMLATVHRAANTEEKTLAGILKAFNTLAETSRIVFPVHPRTKKIIDHMKPVLHPGITLCGPFGYFDMLHHLQHCSLVITDSGGLQKEAYLLGKKSLLLMNFSPWVELVQHKFSVETAADPASILSNFQKLAELNPDFSVNLYGNGDCAGQIASFIQKTLRD